MNARTHTTTIIPLTLTHAHIRILSLRGKCLSREVRARPKAWAVEKSDFVTNNISYGSSDARFITESLPPSVVPISRDNRDKKRREYADSIWGHEKAEKGKKP